VLQAFNMLPGNTNVYYVFLHLIACPQFQLQRQCPVRILSIFETTHGFTPADSALPMPGTFDLTVLYGGQQLRKFCGQYQSAMALKRSLFVRDVSFLILMYQPHFKRSRRLFSFLVNRPLNFYAYYLVGVFML